MKKVSVSVDEHTWYAFRAACRTHEMVASQEIARFMRWKLAEWGYDVSVPDTRQLELFVPSAHEEV